MQEINWDAMNAADGGKFAAWMLSLVDQSPDKLAILEIPHLPEHTIDELEAAFIRSYDRAKRDRPDLSVKLAPGGEEYPDAALVVAVHEHRWVGGRCVNGCPDTRPDS